MGFSGEPAEFLRHLLNAALAAADPAKTLPPKLPKPPAGRTIVIGAGKAAAKMARAVEDHWRGDLTGLVVTRYGHAVPCKRIEVVEAAHPVPDAAGEKAAQRILDLVQGLSADDLVIALMSGGASALLALPAPGISLAEKQAITRELLRCGATISEINAVRKHLSAIKGGWLAARAAGACRTFAISDVVGDDLSVIGSGPTVPDASTFRDTLDLLHRFGGEGGDAAFPRAVIDHVMRGTRGERPETPKPHDPRIARAAATVIGGRRNAMDGAARAAESRGYHVIRIDDAVGGEARLAGPSHLRAVLARAAGAGRPACIVSSGETTVRVTGDGKGGRNQEFALACASILASLGAAAAAASVGTDGIDGPTDAAGALVDNTTLERAGAAHLHPDSFLERNDTYRFFDTLGDLIHTGPTGTNVGDLQTILLA